ncbi:MAG: hypothetical protein IJX64_04010 [Clostridia bacterium]|nr:hypothetical protein [Clostridia bacterium]
MGWLSVFGIAAALSVLPYLRIFAKRVLLVLKMQKCLGKSGARLVPTHRLWMFGRKSTPRCDFYIETKDTVYAVKLFATGRRLSTLVFQNDGKYVTRNEFAIFSYGGAHKLSFDSRPHSLPRYDFQYRFAEDWYLKDFVPVLLVHPICYQIKQGEKDVSSGDMVNGVFVYSLSRLLAKIEYEGELRA